MGGRGASSGGGGGATGGLSGADIVSTTSLISERESYQPEVDRTLQVLQDVQEKYGVVVEDAQLATLKGKGKSALAYYDADGNLAVNKAYFNNAKMDAAYDECVAQKFHPPRGNKTAMEAVVAHEMGHRLTDAAGIKSGAGAWQLDATADKIVAKAAKRQKTTPDKLRARVSGYAKQDSAEAVAEAFADVYCNGSKASASSRAIVRELDKYF